MKKITFLGDKGSGKTVLLSVLAHRYREHTPNRPCFYPLGDTFLHVARAIENLDSGEWPAPTTDGVCIELNWRVSFPQIIETQVQARDYAGNDLRRVFTEKSPDDTLKKLRTELETSDVVVFLLNLRDFVGRPAGERMEKEHMIKEAMDQLIVQDRACAIVLTQIDCYDYLRTQNGTWGNTLKAVAPSLYAGHVASNHIPVFGVSAVADTEACYHPDRPDETVADQKPKPGFTSLGLDTLMQWISSRLSSDASPPLLPTRPAKRRNRSKLIMWAVISLVAIVMLYSCAKCPDCDGTGKGKGLGDWGDCNRCNGTGKR